tara:strand:- start:44 stop:214 length:171 start_codon:yes stop_codon:yes gene_type:complete
MMDKEIVMKKRGATVKYRWYGKLDFEKKFETAKEAKGFFYGFVVKRPNVTGELIIH